MQSIFPLALFKALEPKKIFKPIHRNTSNPDRYIDISIHRFVKQSYEFKNIERHYWVAKFFELPIQYLLWELFINTDKDPIKFLRLLGAEDYLGDVFYAVRHSDPRNGSILVRDPNEDLEQRDLPGIEIIT